jgi:hypothetical protein
MVIFTHFDMEQRSYFPLTTLIIIISLEKYVDLVHDVLKVLPRAKGNPNVFDFFRFLIELKELEQKRQQHLGHQC